jgi:hypothetical protein
LGRPKLEWSVRFSRWTKENSNGCIEWTGNRNSIGYGIANVDKKMRLIHRYVWELENGLIPEGMVVHHKCRNRVCVNIEHLELMTLHDHQSDNIHKRKTHCPYGHEYTPENTYIRPNGARKCRACNCIEQKNRNKQRRSAQREWSRSG